MDGMRAGRRQSGRDTPPECKCKTVIAVAAERIGDVVPRFAAQGGPEEYVIGVELDRDRVRFVAEIESPAANVGKGWPRRGS